jgi:hypothetical protein
MKRSPMKRFSARWFAPRLLAPAILLALLVVACTGGGSAPVTSAIDWPSVAVIVGLVLGGLGSILGIVSTVLHAIAPRTKTTVDDSLRDGVDVVRGDIAVLTALLRGLLGQAAPGTKAAKLPTLLAPTPDLRGATGTTSVLAGGVHQAELVAAQPGPTLAESVAAGVVKVLPDGTITGVAPRNPQAGRARLPVLIALGLLAAALCGAIVIVPGCTAGQRTATPHALVDCTAASSAAIGATAASMRTPVDQGGCFAPTGTDWSCVTAKAVAAGLQIGGCAFLEVVSAPPPARLASATGPTPPDRDGRAAFESYRASTAGGAAFRTAGGVR